MDGLRCAPDLDQALLLLDLLEEFTRTGRFMPRPSG